MLQRLLLIAGIGPAGLMGCASGRAAGPFPTALDPPSTPGALSSVELEDLIAFAELLVESRTLSRAERGYVVEHMEDRIKRSPEYLSLYSEEQRRRHEVRPGVTGWAQVNGRNAQDWDDRLALDVWYVDNWSFGLDVRILARTVAQVVRREGISEPGHATKPNFGSDRDA